MKNDLTREELYNLVWSTTMTSLTKEFNTTIHQLKKKCKEFSIPVPQQGYWVRKRHNKELIFPPLPKDYDGEDIVSIPKKQIAAQDPLMISINEIKKTPGLVFKVPKRLNNPHKLVEDAINSFKGRTAWDGVIRSHYDELDVVVSPGSQGRAMRIMNTLIIALNRRGHDVFNLYKETKVKIGEEQFPIRLLEIRKKVPSSKEYRSYVYQATGVFKFQYSESFRRKEIKEGKLSLERLLPKILTSLETFAENERKERIEREVFWKKREEIQKKEEEIRKSKEEDDKKFKQLIEDSNRWRQAQIMREYINHIQTQEEVEDSWMKWALQKVDWYDPAIT